MKKLTKFGLVFASAFALSLSVVCGSLNIQTTVSAEDSQTVQFSETKIKRSQDMNYLLIATAVNNYEDVYEIGYDFEGYTVQDTDKVRNDAYFSSITTGGKTETAKEIFGETYEGWGMIVWEIAYNPAEEISYTPYALVGVRNEESGELLKPTDPSLIDKEVGTTRTTPVLEKTVTFVDGETEVTRTAKYGVGLTENVPEFTGTPTTGKEFYWALEDGTEVTSFASLIKDLTVTKTERAIVNSVAFDFDLDVTYDDGYEFLTADGEDTLSKNVDFVYGENIAFAVYVKNEFNRSVDDVKYVFHNADGTTKEFTASEAENNLVVYTLDTADAGDGYVEKVGEYKENTYEFVLNLDLYDWGVLKSLDGVTVTLAGKAVEVIDGKVEAALAAGTYSVVVTEPTTKTTEMEVVVEHPTTWGECLTFVAEETVTVGYSRNTATASNGTTDWTQYFPQDENGAIVANSGTPGNTTNGANIKFTDYVIDGSKDYAVKARFTYNGDNYSSSLSPFYRLYLRNASGNNFAVIVNKLYILIQINGGTEYKVNHNKSSVFSSGLANAATTPFEFDVMVVKTEGKLSVYHTVGSTDGSYTHFVDVTSAGIKLPNGEFAHTYNTTTDITFDTTVATNVNNFLAAKDLNLWLRTSNAAVATVYSEYGVKTANFTADYTVEHYLQKADKSGYELKEDATETLTGVINTVATAVEKTFDGYELSSGNEDAVLQGVITSDGNLVLKLYYYSTSLDVTATHETSKENYTEYFTKDENGVLSATDITKVENTNIRINESFNGAGDYVANVRFSYKGGGATPFFRLRITNGSNQIVIYLDKTQYGLWLYNPDTLQQNQYNTQHSFGTAYIEGLNNATESNPFVFDIKIEKTGNTLTVYHTIGTENGAYTQLGSWSADSSSTGWYAYFYKFLTAENLYFEFAAREKDKTINVEFSNYYVTIGKEN